MNIYTMQSPTRRFIQVTKIKIDPMAATNIMVFTVSSKPPIINQRPDIAGEADASGKTWWRAKKNRSLRILGLMRVKHGKTIINHPIFLEDLQYTNVYHWFMVIWGIVYDCFILFQSLYNTIYEFHLSKPLKTHLGPKIRRMFKPIRMVPSGKLT